MNRFLAGVPCTWSFRHVPHDSFIPWVAWRGDPRESGKIPAVMCHTKRDLVRRTRKISTIIGPMEHRGWRVSIHPTTFQNVATRDGMIIKRDTLRALRKTVDIIDASRSKRLGTSRPARVIAPGPGSNQKGHVMIRQLFGAGLGALAMLPLGVAAHPGIQGAVVAMGEVTIADGPVTIKQVYGQAVVLEVFDPAPGMGFLRCTVERGGDQIVMETATYSDVFRRAMPGVVDQSGDYVEFYRYEIEVDLSAGTCAFFGVWIKHQDYNG